MFECKIFVYGNFVLMWNMFIMCVLCFYYVIYDIILNEIEFYSILILLFGKMNFYVLLE